MKEYLQNLLKKLKIDKCAALHLIYHTTVFGGGGYYIAEVNKALDRAEQIVETTEAKALAAVSSAEEVATSSLDRVQDLQEKLSNSTNKFAETTSKLEERLKQLEKSCKKFRL